MGSKCDLHAFLGCLAVAALLLLSWPGVEVVSANDDAAMTLDPALVRAPVCSADTPPAPPVSAVLEQVRRSAQASHRGPTQVVTLNNTGYDEGPPPNAAMDLMRVELEQLRPQP